MFKAPVAAGWLGWPPPGRGHPVAAGWLAGLASAVGGGMQILKDFELKRPCPRDLCFLRGQASKSDGGPEILSKSRLHE